MIPQEDVRIKRIGSKYLIVTGIFTQPKSTADEKSICFDSSLCPDPPNAHEN